MIQKWRTRRQRKLWNYSRWWITHNNLYAIQCRHSIRELNRHWAFYCSDDFYNLFIQWWFEYCWGSPFGGVPHTLLSRKLSLLFCLKVHIHIKRNVTFQFPWPVVSWGLHRLYKCLVRDVLVHCNNIFLKSLGIWDGAGVLGIQGNPLSQLYDRHG